jgi:hypothetical protein
MTPLTKTLTGHPRAEAPPTDWNFYQETEIYILVLVGFGPVPSQSWARDRYERPRLAKCCINQRRSTPETDSKAPTPKSKIRP